MLLAWLREAFGWQEEIIASAGPRGALGQIWQIKTGQQAYALKELFGDPPSPALIEAELLVTRLAAEAGVRLPASHPDRRGNHLLTAPGGERLRLYDWIDLQPVDLTTAAGRVGELVARLHRSAPATRTEAGGAPPSPWYDRLPDAASWEIAASSAAPWAERLAGRLATLPELCAAVTPVDPDDLIFCHRDLHPENVLADATGELVVVDWDDLGPAPPAREIAGALFDWFCPGPSADLQAMNQMYAAYRQAGGPGRITGPADFTMMLASRLNFLLGQTGIVLDPGAEQRHREWAEHEIDEALTILPTPRQLNEALTAVGAR